MYSSVIDSPDFRFWGSWPFYEEPTVQRGVSWALLMSKSLGKTTVGWVVMTEEPRKPILKYVNL